MRINKLIGLLPETTDGIIITSESGIKYFTGFDCDAGILLVTKNGSVFFTDSRYTEAAGKVITVCDTEDSVRLSERLPARCAEFGVKKLSLESSRITVARADKFINMLADVEFSLTDEAEKAIASLRAVKDETEVSLIKRAQAIAEKGFDHILGYIRPGMTEREIKLELDYFMLKNGADALSFDTIAISGENSSMPHGVPTDRKTKKGDLITFDFGAAVNGYRSDMTRTVALGGIGDEQRRVYEIVLRAQEAALSVLREGVTCRDADAAARDIITAEGFGDNFGHGTGHGVGIEIHEAPSLSPRSGETLTAGNVVTVEPGIYIPGSFGIRIEDMALITKDGCENLTSCPKDIIII